MRSLRPKQEEYRDLVPLANGGPGGDGAARAAQQSRAEISRSQIRRPDRRDRKHRVIANGILVLLGIGFLTPMIWLIDAAFSTHASSALSAPSFTFANFGKTISQGAGRAIGNSLYLGIVSTVIATVVSILAGYALSRHRVPLKAFFLLSVLFLSALPFQLLLIPIYEIYVHLGWLDSPFYTSVALAANSVPFAIWLLKNFIDQVPREFEEAAAIEGAGSVRILSKVVVPLAMPGILVAAILTFINAWGAFLLPLVIDTNPADTPAAIGIYGNILADAQVQYGPLAAYAILFSIPVVLLYLACTRWLNGGFAFAGGVKG
jgi:multiple sugar transport system permease protein